MQGGRRNCFGKNKRKTLRINAIQQNPKNNQNGWFSKWQVKNKMKVDILVPIFFSTHLVSLFSSTQRCIKTDGYEIASFGSIGNLPFWYPFAQSRIHTQAGVQPRDSGALVSKSPLKQVQNKTAMEAAILNHVLGRD